MNYLWRIIRNVMAIAGLMCIFAGVGTADYYVMELGQAAPPYTMDMAIIGCALMIPIVIQMAWEKARGEY